MSKKNNVISAIKSSWKDLQKSLTEFSYDKLAQQDSSFSNQVLNTLYEISLKEISVINNISSENMSNKKPLKIIIISHMGRPKGFDPKLSLEPVRTYLEKILQINIVLIKY